MAKQPNLKDKETEIVHLEGELRFILNSPAIRDSLIKRGDALRLANESIFSFLTGSGVYLDLNTQTKEVAITHLGYRGYMGYPDKEFDIYPETTVLNTRQAAEYLVKKGIGTRNLQSKLKRLVA
ncbi:MAG TPA: hypothetical protein VJ438_05030 [Candidatus Nanoarchaeia archaeon]|nr:hypothetical protein [Candidatus Nanoarchaeia archaeon]